MKSILTTIGTASATAALLSLTALAQDTTRLGAQPSASSTQGSESQVHLEGKIVSLFEYLSGQQGMSGASSSQSSGISSPTTPSATTPGQQRLGQQDSTDPQRSTDILGRDRSGTTTTTPGASTATPGASGAFSGTAAWAGQPLALVVESSQVGASQRSSALSQESDATRQSSVTDPTRQSSTSAQANEEKSSSYSSLQGASGDVYVLVFDPQDASSRAAFTKAQWMASGRSGGISSTTSDRLPVRGPGETDPNRSSIDRERDPSRTDTTRTDPSRIEQSDLTGSTTASRTYSSAHSIGKKVKVTGKILNKGGIQAIEVASIEDATGASESGQDTLRSTTPRNE